MSAPRRRDWLWTLNVLRNIRHVSCQNFRLRKCSATIRRFRNPDAVRLSILEGTYVESYVDMPVTCHGNAGVLYVGDVGGQQHRLRPCCTMVDGTRDVDVGYPGTRET